MLAGMQLWHTRPHTTGTARLTQLRTGTQQQQTRPCAAAGAAGRRCQPPSTPAEALLAGRVLPQQQQAAQAPTAKPQRQHTALSALSALSQAVVSTPAAAPPRLGACLRAAAGRSLSRDQAGQATQQQQPQLLQGLLPRAASRSLPNQRRVQQQQLQDQKVQHTGHPGLQQQARGNHPATMWQQRQLRAPLPAEKHRQQQPLMCC